MGCDKVRRLGARQGPVWGVVRRGYLAKMFCPNFKNLRMGVAGEGSGERAGFLATFLVKFTAVICFMLRRPDQS